MATLNASGVGVVVVGSGVGVAMSFAATRENYECFGRRGIYFTFTSVFMGPGVCRPEGRRERMIS